MVTGDTTVVFLLPLSHNQCVDAATAAAASPPPLPRRLNVVSPKIPLLASKLSLAPPPTLRCSLAVVDAGTLCLAPCVEL